MASTLNRKADGETVGQLDAVLFVEDEMDDFVLARHCLSKLKLRNPVHCVRCLDELMAYLAGRAQFADRNKFPQPAVIVLDQRLPHANGLQVQAKLRSSLAMRNLPIVVISSPENLNMLKAAVDLGANAYMLKPFDPGVFSKLVRKLELPLEFSAD